MNSSITFWIAWWLAAVIAAYGVTRALLAALDWMDRRW